MSEDPKPLDYNPIPEGWKPHLTWNKEPCGLPDLNDALDLCDRETGIDIAWDQWARVRISCLHGVAEGVSGGLCLNEAWHEAMKSFLAMSHEARICYADTDPPESWKDPERTTSWEFWREHQTDCELFWGHDGDHRAFDDEDEDDLKAYIYDHLQYFKNGVNRTGTPVFGSTDIPHPYYLEGKKNWEKKLAAKETADAQGA